MSRLNGGRRSGPFSSPRKGRPLTTGLFLAGAIVSEVGASLALKVASAGKVVWYAVVGVENILAFAFLTAALRGMSLHPGI